MYNIYRTMPISRKELEQDIVEQEWNITVALAIVAISIYLSFTNF
jgi:hypothetical protein